MQESKKHRFHPVPLSVVGSSGIRPPVGASVTWMPRVDHHARYACSEKYCSIATRNPALSPHHRTKLLRDLTYLGSESEQRIRLGHKRLESDFTAVLAIDRGASRMRTGEPNTRDTEGSARGCTVASSR